MFPTPTSLRAEIVEDLQAALAQVEIRSLPTLAHCLYLAHSRSARPLPARLNRPCRSPRSLHSLAALLSMSLIPFAPLAEIANDLKRNRAMKDEHAQFPGSDLSGVGSLPRSFMVRKELLWRSAKG
jgi:hypothetical protein